MKKRNLWFYALVMALGFNINAQEAGQSNDDLAKQLQNPVASLISLPFQPNFDFGVGPADGFRMLMNVQPVVPLSISEKTNLITRLVLPVVWQSDVFGDSGTQFGLGDALISGFFSPKAPTKGGIIWGAGPAILIPSGTDELLGAGKFGLGPTAVILTQVSGFTVGGLVNHIVSIAGESDRPDVNSTFFQPFVAHNFAGGYALALNTELAMNWEADSTNGTINLVGSRVFSIGKQSCQLALGPRIPYGNGNTASWGIRTAFVLLFPT